MRLIDADELKTAFPTCDNSKSILIASVRATINHMPTIEVRKTGKWEIYVISMFDGEGCRCSECGFEGVPYWDYCPNCGARMEDEE